VAIAIAMNQPLSASCHCGAVQISIAARPEYLNDCNCSLCASHGVWWGYFAPAEVEVTGATKSYARADKAEPVVKIHFCTTCGCTTHFRTMDGFAERTGGWSISSDSGNRFRASEMRSRTTPDVMGVNMRLVDRSLLAGIELRYPDGQNWDGIGQWDFIREAEILT
jgi:hypothetical protein